MRIALAQMNATVGSLDANIAKILKYIAEAKEQQAEMVVFPELCLCGYPPEDLLLLPRFIQAVNEGLKRVIEASQGIYVLLGTVRENPTLEEKNLYNTAAIIYDRNLIGFQDKTLLPTYDVFSERRYFEPASHSDVWSINGLRVAITICEDIWQHAGAVDFSSYARDPISTLSVQKPDLLINLSASPFHEQKFPTRLRVVSAAAQTLGCQALFCNLIGGNDSLIFDGYSFSVDKRGNLLQVAKGFQEDLLVINTGEQVSPIQWTMEPVEDVFQALVLGIRDYFQKSGFTRACLGLSGGIDSAVVACLAVAALGQENLLTLALPSRFNPPESQADAQVMADHLGIELKTLSIEAPFQSYLDLLKADFYPLAPGVAEENIQARIRGTLLMAFSNKFGYLLLSTGNKSELAMGYSTLYGDMCGGLAVLSDVLKTQVYALASFINRRSEVIPQTIIDKPPSAELRPNQKDSDSLPEYAILDKILQNYIEKLESPEEIAETLGFPLDLVKAVVHTLRLNEYKRRQAPPGLRVTKRAFSAGWRFPIVQHWNL